MIAGPAPPFWTTRPSDVAVRDGGEAVTRCEAGGDPRPLVAWKRLTAAPSQSPSSSSWTPLTTSDPSQLVAEERATRGRRSLRLLCIQSDRRRHLRALPSHSHGYELFLSTSSPQSAVSVKLPATRHVCRDTFRQSEACSSQPVVSLNAILSLGSPVPDGQLFQSFSARAAPHCFHFIRM